MKRITVLSLAIVALLAADVQANPLGAIRARGVIGASVFRPRVATPFVGNNLVLRQRTFFPSYGVNRIGFAGSYGVPLSAPIGYGVPLQAQLAYQQQLLMQQTYAPLQQQFAPQLAPCQQQALAAPYYQQPLAAPLAYGAVGTGCPLAGATLGLATGGCGVNPLTGSPLSAPFRGRGIRGY